MKEQPAWLFPCCKQELWQHHGHKCWLCEEAGRVLVAG